MSLSELRLLKVVEYELMPHHAGYQRVRLRVLQINGVERWVIMQGNGSYLGRRLWNKRYIFQSDILPSQLKTNGYSFNTAQQGLDFWMKNRNLIITQNEWYNFVKSLKEKGVQAYEDEE